MSPFPQILRSDKEELLKKSNISLDEIVKRYARTCYYCRLVPVLIRYDSIAFEIWYDIRCRDSQCRGNSTQAFRKTNRDKFIDTLNYWNFMQWYHDTKPFQFTTNSSKIIIPETYQIKTFFSLSDV